MKNVSSLSFSLSCVYVKPHHLQQYIHHSGRGVSCVSDWLWGNQPMITTITSQPNAPPTPCTQNIYLYINVFVCIDDINECCMNPNDTHTHMLTSRQNKSIQQRIRMLCWSGYLSVYFFSFSYLLLSIPFRLMWLRCEFTVILMWCTHNVFYTHIRTVVQRIWLRNSIIFDFHMCSSFGSYTKLITPN